MTQLKILSTCCEGALMQNYDIPLNKLGQEGSREILAPAADGEYAIDLADSAHMG